MVYTLPTIILAGFEMKISCQRNGPLKMYRDRTSSTNTYESETHCDRSIQRPNNSGTETFSGQRVTEPICHETTRIIREYDYSPASAIFDAKCTIVTFLHNHVNNLYIKGRNSVANLRKMTIYNPKIYLVNDNVYTNFGLNKSIHSQDI